MAGIQNFLISNVPPSESAPALYDFSFFDFSSANTVGRTGPSLSTLKSFYNTSTNPWLNNTSFYNAVNGIQYWTVPQTATYKIRVAGASGTNTAGSGYTGAGAIMQANFILEAGTILFILVGQQSYYNGIRPWQGGGGGTFVATGNSVATSDPLIVAGGGGTIRSTTTYNQNLRANTGTSGKNGSGSNGGTGGYAASGGGHNADSSGGGAAGFYTDGNSKGDLRRPVFVSGYNYFLGAQSFRNGGEGGHFDTTYDTSQPSSRSGLHGGFGCGGPGGWGGSGGGGGYSGGGNCNNSNYSGGGGSFIASAASNAWTSDGSFYAPSSVTAPYPGSVGNLNAFNYKPSNGYCTITKL